MAPAWTPRAQPPTPPGRGFFRLPGHGVTIGVLDTGMWKGQLDWYNGNVTGW